MATFAERLRQLRAERGISTPKLAEELGIAKSTISQYENNKRSPDGYILAKLAEYFNVSVEYLLGKTDIPDRITEANTDSAHSKELEKFKTRIKELRQKNNLTQKELGEKLGLTESTVSLYEAGKRKPDPSTLVKLANIFDVSIDYLLGRTDDPTNPVKGIVTREDFERVLGPGDYPEVMAFKEYIDRENLTWEEAMKLLELAKKIRDMSK